MKPFAHLRPRLLPAPRRAGQRGLAAVELALIMLFAFLPLLLGILEVSRLFYVADMAQEVTRRAARDQVVRWTSQTGAVQRDAVLQCGAPLTGATLACTSAGAVSLPAGAEVTNTAVTLGFYHTYADALSGSSPITGIATPQDNLNTCLRDASDANCMLFVRAALQGVSYTSMVGWFGELFRLPLPDATVIMPAEALGLL